MIPTIFTILTVWLLWLTFKVLLNDYSIHYNLVEQYTLRDKVAQDTDILVTHLNNTLDRVEVLEKNTIVLLTLE